MVVTSLLIPSLSILHLLLLAPFSSVSTLARPISLISRDDESYAQKAEDWCNTNSSGCKGVIAVSALAGVLIIFIVIRYLRRRKKASMEAETTKQLTQNVSDQQEIQRAAQETFFHQQRKIKMEYDLKRDAELMGLSVKPAAGSGTV
nr:uncharacterized protein CI109_001198 [Kwoniella shandongensis]KAA5530395.1 hypothetical protein CI109_001198 [Kwoniella shandongensis]